MLLTLFRNNFTLTTKPSESYKFQLRAHTKLGWTYFTPERLVSLHSIAVDKPLTSDLTKNFVDNKYVVIIGPFIVLILLIVVMILGFIYIKK